MSLIKIVANGIEIDFVRESLSIKKENNALNRDFKVSYSSIPFLIIENTNAKKALGTRELASVNKLKTVDVLVFESGKKYTGELQILSYINGFRKCNLKYASEILSIMNKKISDFMPVVSVIPGETNPAPYTEESIAVVPGYDNWKTYPMGFIQNGFPNVKWQFPQMLWSNKFGQNLAADDEWKTYQGSLNKYNDDQTALVDNYFTENTTDITDVFNKNVASPQVYLLSPLFYALNSIGFSADGQFYNSEFIKKILFLSLKNNLSKIILTKLLSSIVFPNTWTLGSVYGYYSRYRRKDFAITVPDQYTLDYSFTFDGPINKNNYGLYSLNYSLQTPGMQTIFVIQEVIGSSYTISGSAIVDADKAETLKIYLQANTEVMPSSYTLTLNKKSKKNFHEMHPTINLGRYVPDWSFGTYLNAIQNIFNLEINIDDNSKKMVIDFNEQSITEGSKSVLNKSLAVIGYEQTPSDAFLLKYENSEDLALWITKEGAVTFDLQASSFVERIDNKFKFVPNTYTAVLSEELDSKSGEGLIIYDPAAGPYISSSYLGQTLKMEGSKGIYEVFWRKFIKFLLNGSAVEMSGPFTETEINKIIDLKRIFIDNQEYIIASTESRETEQNNYLVKFDLVSVNF